MIQHATSWSSKVFISLLLALGFVVSSTALIAEPASAVEVKAGYYDNYFKNVHTCKSRGNQLMKTQPDWISFLCYKTDGDTKWSMDAYVDDGLGCLAPSREDSAVRVECG